jgi:hypothetical protein
MTSYEAYITYLAVKMHFSRGTYDFFKYHGQVKTSKEVFDARRDIMKFQKMSRIKYPLHEYLAVNLRDNASIWVGEVLRPEAELNYLKYRKIIESFAYHLGNELEKIGCIKTSLRIGSDGEVPKLLDLHLSGAVSLETIIVLDDLIGFSKKFDKKMTLNPLWEDISYKMNKFRPFMVSYDKKKLSDIVRTHVESYK